MSKMLIATAAVWLTGASSTAALVTSLSQPPMPALQEEERAEISRQPMSLVANDGDPSESFAVPAPHKAAPRQMGFYRTPKAKEMRCGELKSLQQGSIDQGVRTCSFQ
jgi:hypothetical protein